MAASIARIYGLIFVWHALRHFNSYVLLGSQSSFENPRAEWLILGLLQMVVGGLLLYKPKPWHLVTAAIILFLWCVAYPVVLHVGESAFIVLLLGLALVQSGGDTWIPLATLPSILGVALAGLCKLLYGKFSVCNLTHYVLVRYPWVDGINLFLNQHETLTALMSNLTIGIELASPCIWVLLFFPRLWLVRSLLALLPISLLLGIGITGNLDEFPWVVLTAWLLMLGPQQPKLNPPIRLTVYPLAFFLGAASFFNLAVNLQRIFFPETDNLFDRDSGLIPEDRAEKVAFIVLGPRWDMYVGPLAQDQMFGGETSRILKLELRIKSDRGCGLALNRWERIYWERIRQCLKNSEQHEAALTLRNRYKKLEGQPCSIIVLPAPM